MNEQFSDLLRSTSSFDDRKDNFKSIESSNSPINNITINLTKSPPPAKHSINLELEKLSNTINESFMQSNEDQEQQTTEAKSIPIFNELNLKPNQDVNNISFQTEDDVDLDKLIKKIEQDAILQDELGLY